VKSFMLAYTEPVVDPLPKEMDIAAWVAIHEASGKRFFGDHRGSRLAAASGARRRPCV